MKRIIADKLKIGDEIRVIAPSRSLAIIGDETRKIAKKRFDELGLKLSFGKHVEEIDEFTSSSVDSRLQDFHEAFLDPNVRAILTVIGGFNSNQLLKYIDWKIVKDNPKIFCGFSDITVLNNAVFAKTGLVTYSGPHYSSFGMRDYFDYNFEYFKKCLMSDNPIDIKPSHLWTDDAWFMNQNDRKPIKNEGCSVIHEGTAKGTIVGANLCTFNLLQGTEYMPSLQDTILFLEDDSQSQLHDFDRDLVSLIQQPGFSGVKGIVFGRFQNSSHVTLEAFTRMISTKNELAKIPIIANVDFGHTNTIITYPIGGSVSMESITGKSSIKITEH